MVMKHTLEIYNPSLEMDHLTKELAKICIRVVYEDLSRTAQDFDFVELTQHGKPVAVFVAWDKYKNDNEAE